MSMDLTRIIDTLKKADMLKNCLNELNADLFKINAFEGEVPFCALVLKEAIKKLNHEIVCSMKMNENLTTKEFMPLKGGNLKSGVETIKFSDDDKKNWMRGAKLWCDGDLSSNTNKEAKSQLNSRLMEEDVGSYENPYDQMLRKFNKSEGPFVPFNIQSDVSPINSHYNGPVAFNYNGNFATTSTHRPSTPSFLIDSSIKPRRCWSEELHQRFLIVLERLGGPNDATPKQIKKRMGINDLTNYEIKSHLQKYRNHLRKVGALSTAVAATSSSSILWMSEGPNGSGSGNGCDGADKEGNCKFQAQN